RTQNRTAMNQADGEPDVLELRGHHRGAPGDAAAATVPARSRSARRGCDRDAGGELLRHQLPRDRPDADGPDDPGAAVRPDAGGEPAVVDRREHGHPRMAAAAVHRHQRAPHDDAQRERRRLRDGRQGRSGDGHDHPVRPHQGPQLVRAAVRLHAREAEGDRRGRRQVAARQHAVPVDERAGRGRQAHLRERADGAGGQLRRSDADRPLLRLPRQRHARLRVGDGAQQAVRIDREHVRRRRRHVRRARLQGTGPEPDPRRVLRRRVVRPAAIALAAAALGACTSSPTVRGFVGQKGLATDAGMQCPVATTPPNRGASAGCGKATTLTPGKYGRFSLTVECEKEGARDRLYYVRLPPNYDPAKPHRTVYLGPGCGPPQDLIGASKVYPMEAASGPAAILVAMEQGFYNKAEYNSSDCIDPRTADGGTGGSLCHYCFDDGAGSPLPDSAEYGYFDRLHQQIRADYCVATTPQF